MANAQDLTNRAEYLYHSFSRGLSRRSNKSLETLRSILQLGLLVTPEIVQWRAMDGSEFRVAQKRACFTALGDGDLTRHSELFGPITVCFLRSDLERIGATPVFYVPRALSTKRGMHNFGGFQMERLYQLLTLVGAVRSEGSHVDFRGKPLNLVDLENYVRALTTLFYPIEDIEQGRDRYYLAQKEWRIIGNLIYQGEEMSRRLTEQERLSVASLNPDYFNRTYEFPTGEYKLVDQCLLIERIDSSKFGQYIQRVYAPKTLHDSVQALLKEFGLDREVLEYPS